MVKTKKAQILLAKSEEKCKSASQNSNTTAKESRSIKNAKKLLNNAKFLKHLLNQILAINQKNFAQEI